MNKCDCHRRKQHDANRKKLSETKVFLELYPCMEQLIEIIAKLRSPEGCPWDRKQTHESLIPYLLEESWEVIDEIKDGKVGDPLKEELGDLLLQVVLHAQIAKEDSRFTFQDVIHAISQKMVNRHPHVFDPQSEKFSEEELRQRWHQQKFEESGRKSVMDGISETVPALMSALKIGQRAASLGFDWESVDEVWDKIQEEIQEVKVEIERENKEKLEEEIGDLIFAVTNLARHYKINPEIALHKANKKFKSRFVQVEEAIQEAKKSGKELSLEEMETHWSNAKKKESEKI